MTQKIDRLVEWVTSFDLSQLEKTEDDVETKFIIPLFQDYLGYPIACRRGKYPISNHSTKKRGRKPEIDQMFFSSEESIKHGPETALILIEAKRQGESLSNAIEQAKFYSYYLKPIIYVVIDGIKILTYKQYLRQFRAN